MRILKANNILLDIDDETAIGIDSQAYDFTKAGDLKINVSNSFSIPTTAKNLKIFGFIGRVYSFTAIEYEKILIDYYILNTQYITGGVARVEKIEGGRIHLFVAERPAFIDMMKTTSLNIFIKDWFENVFNNGNFSTFPEFVDAYGVGSEGVRMPLFNGNLSLVAEEGGFSPERVCYWTGVAFTNTIAMGVEAFHEDLPSTFAQGGHFSVYINRLLLHIETYFNVDLSKDLPAAYNLFQDDLINKLSIPVREISYLKQVDNYTLEFITVDSYTSFAPHGKLKPYEGLTVYDFFITTLRLLGYALEPMANGRYEIVRLDLMTLVKTKSDYLPGYMADDPRNMPYIPNIKSYGVNNIIKMRPYSDGGETLGAKSIVNANKNLDEIKDLFKIDAYIPPFLTFDNVFIPDMAAPDSFKNITFFKDAYTYYQTMVWGTWGRNMAGGLYPPTESHTRALMIPEVYTVASEYVFLEEMLQEPETRTVKRWVNSTMMIGFRKLGIYYVREFGGWYFVNKISNFNPDKSTEPVEFELIKMPWVRFPELPPEEIDSSDVWILAEGRWNDSGIWIDTETWNDLN